MKQLLPLILLVFSPIALIGQHSSYVDSLLNELSTAKEDTNKVIILLQLFDPTVINDLDKAYEYTREAQLLSEKIGWEKGVGASLQRKGIIWGYRGNLDKARESYLKAIEIQRRLHQKVIAATLIYNLGLLYQEQGLYDSAVIYNDRAAKIFLDHGDSLKYASTLDLYASIHNEQGNYYQSTKYAVKAANLYHKYGDELREADALVKVGNGYTIQNQYGHAISYYLDAIKLYKKHNDKNWEITALQKIAETYLYLQNYDLADSLISYSLLLSDTLGAIPSLGEGYSIKGDISFARGQYRPAIKYYEKAMEINKQAADSTFISTAVISLGKCYQQLGQLAKASNLYMSVLPTSLKNNVRENIREIYKNLSEISEKNGEPTLALTYYKKYIAAKDSIYNNEQSRQISDLQTKYDTEKKGREIELKNRKITILEQKAEIQELLRLRLIVSIIVIIIFFVLGLYLLWLRNKKNRLVRAIENDRLNHELDLKKQELATHTLHIIQKNELLQNLKNKLSELTNNNQHIAGGTYSEIDRLINTNKFIDRDWRNFKTVFDQVHPDFFTRLRSQANNISASELRMAAMMKMNLNTKEMASILNITPESVKKARYRMRKKLNLEAEANVHDYLMTI